MCFNDNLQIFDDADDTLVFINFASVPIPNDQTPSMWQ